MDKKYTAKLAKELKGYNIIYSEVKSYITSDKRPRLHYKVCIKHIADDEEQILNVDFRADELGAKRFSRKLMKGLA